MTLPADFLDDERALEWLARIRTTLAQIAMPEERPLRIMNVCGGHERSVSRLGLRGLLPPGIELIPGPGCPVCVCPEEDLYQALQLALCERVRLLAFGDMLRVPVNVAPGAPRSLLEARAAGADVVPLASPMEAVVAANAQPDKPHVFFVAGFETTLAPVAALIVQGLPANLWILSAGKLTWPAVAHLLARRQTDGTPARAFDGLIAPGHVATLMGTDEWRFVTEMHRLPVAVAGFHAVSLLAGVYSVLRQHGEGRSFVDNAYPELVHPQGNPRAQALLHQVFDIVDSPWRGIGTLPASGWALRSTWAAHDANRHFPDYRQDARRRAGAMPPGCACADVVMGLRYPNQCPLYGKGCTPATPIGPCMVSDEGACRIWWSSGVRERVVS